jgi:hypothetical protein
MVNRIFIFGEKATGRSMRVEYSFLCEYADPTRGDLINIFGAGLHSLPFTKLPDKRPLTLVMSIEYSQEAVGEHKVDIRLIDSDGKDRICPLTSDVVFPTDKRFYGFDIRLCPLFHRYEYHSVEVTVDGRRVASIPLTIELLND